VITLVNNSENFAFAFKLQTNAPDRYVAYPAHGVIAPMTLVEVKVRLLKNVEKNDKFLVLSTAIHSDAVSFSLEQWSKANKDSMTKHLVLVKHVELGDVDSLSNKVSAASQ